MSRAGGIPGLQAGEDVNRERFPRLSVVRRVLPDQARYLGPFPSAAQAELVKTAIEDALPLRRCSGRIGPRARVSSPCILLQLGRCLGPCRPEADEAAYAAVVHRFEQALEGDPEPLLAPLRRRMAAYAAAQRYEQAAMARDRLEALSRALGEARRRRTLSAVEELVVARPHPDGREVVVLRHGQLAAVAVLPAGDDQGVERLQATAAQPERFGGPPPRHLADELALVSRWLDRVAGHAELLAVRGRLASPARGGAALQVRYDPRRGRGLRLPGEAEGRPEPRPARRPQARPPPRHPTGHAVTAARG